MNCAPDWRESGAQWDSWYVIASRPARRADCFRCQPSTRSVSAGPTDYASRVGPGRSAGLWCREDPGPPMDPAVRVGYGPGGVRGCRRLGCGCLAGTRRRARSRRRGYGSPVPARRPAGYGRRAGYGRVRSRRPAGRGRRAGSSLLAVGQCPAGCGPRAGGGHPRDPGCRAGRGLAAGSRYRRGQPTDPRRPRDPGRQDAGRGPGAGPTWLRGAVRCRPGACRRTSRTGR